MPNQDGYPTDEELETIEKWHYNDLPGWFAFIKSIWWMPDWGWQERKEVDELTLRENQVFVISTGGWSGNEDIIGAMKKNRFAWIFSWYSSRRGGHFVFMLDAGAQGATEVHTLGRGGSSPPPATKSE